MRRCCSVAPVNDGTPDKTVADRAAVAEQIHALVADYFSIEEPDDELSCPLSVPLYGAEEVNGAVDVLLTQRVTMGRPSRA